MSTVLFNDIENIIPHASFSAEKAVLTVEADSYFDAQFESSGKFAADKRTINQLVNKVDILVKFATDNIEAQTVIRASVVADTTAHAHVGSFLIENPYTEQDLPHISHIKFDSGLSQGDYVTTIRFLDDAFKQSFIDSLSAEDKELLEQEAGGLESSIYFITTLYNKGIEYKFRQFIADNLNQALKDGSPFIKRRIQQDVMTLAKDSAGEAKNALVKLLDL